MHFSYKFLQLHRTFELKFEMNSINISSIQKTEST